MTTLKIVLIVFWSLFIIFQVINIIMISKRIKASKKLRKDFTDIQNEIDDCVARLMEIQLVYHEQVENENKVIK